MNQVVPIKCFDLLIILTSPINLKAIINSIGNLAV